MLLISHVTNEIGSYSFHRLDGLCHILTVVGTNAGYRPTGCLTFMTNKSEPSAYCPGQTLTLDPAEVSGLELIEALLLKYFPITTLCYLMLNVYAWLMKRWKILMGIITTPCKLRGKPTRETSVTPSCTTFVTRFEGSGDSRRVHEERVSSVELYIYLNLTTFGKRFLSSACNLQTSPSRSACAGG